MDVLKLPQNMVGAMGRYDRIHRGIGYSLHNLGARRWRWEVSPPSGVQGLRMESGEVEGELRDAECAAQSVIEQQTGQYTL
ncbi:MAG TPA: hypothetical protein VH189_07165 [Rhizomicrobium sp.]|jgi:hypothetical protein|nr:hypothetical protein [Rhizomicrobium sp.]